MIIALVAQKGGVGKSTLAVSIAWELQARGNRVLLVDADLQGTVRTTVEVAIENGLTPPTVVAMGKDMHKPGQLMALASTFDHTIIDTPGRGDGTQASALMVADVALLPGGDSAADAWGLTYTIAMVQSAQIERPRLRAAVVVTRKAPNTHLGKTVRAVYEGCGLPLFAAETIYRVAWKECLAVGKGVAQHAPKSPAAAELRSIVNETLAFGAEVHQNEVVNG